MDIKERIKKLNEKLSKDNLIIFNEKLKDISIWTAPEFRVERTEILLEDWEYM